MQNRLVVWLWAALVITSLPVVSHAAAKKTPKKPAVTKPAPPPPAEPTQPNKGGKRRVELAPEVVNGTQQRPRATYVLPANVGAVREAANSITDERLRRQK